MKEKQEYAKMLTGKKNAFEMQSQASVREPNAYDYGGEVQNKIQEINDKLQRFNPSLVGSQIVADDTYDTEAAVIETGRRDPYKRRHNDSRIDDTRSVMSAMTNASAVSRRSGVSLLDIGSIASANPSSMGGMKKLPGERGLRANAERRLEKAQMTRIDAHLARLQNTYAKTILRNKNMNSCFRAFPVIHNPKLYRGKVRFSRSEALKPNEKQ